MTKLAHWLADIPDDATLSAWLVIAVAIAGFAVGMYLIRRSADPGPQFSPA